MKDSEYDEKPHWLERTFMEFQDSARRSRDDREAALENEFLDEHLLRTVNSYFVAKIKPDTMVMLLNDHWDLRRSESLEIIARVEKIRARRQRRAEIDKSKN